MENRDYSHPLLLPLNAYQAANLLWLLKSIWRNVPIENINNGDWIGEIPIALETLMKEYGTPYTEHHANSGVFPLDGPVWDDEIKENKWPNRNGK